MIAAFGDPGFSAARELFDMPITGMSESTMQAADTGFTWDLYVMAGNPLVHSDAYAGSENINAGNLFNSPDGMVFDSNGLLWIQTDGSDSNEGDYEGMGNNQMLVGDPATGEIAIKRQDNGILG